MLPDELKRDFYAEMCRHQASVTAGTVFDETRALLRTWLAAAWYLTNQKQGVSALGLQRRVGDRQL